jgi:hypothetical protein
MINSIKIRKDISDMTAREIKIRVYLAALIAIVGGLVMGYGGGGLLATPPAAHAGTIITMGPAPAFPLWTTVADCEDNGGHAPCYTIDEGADGTPHWIVVTSFEPYRALIMDDMIKVSGGVES